MIPYRDTPVTELFHDLFAPAKVRVFIKREDLNSLHAPGNKWWKLAPNIEAALSEGQRTILTFGGAFSNHIYATAAAANAVGLRSIGIIRGERVSPLNPILKSAEKNGMELHFMPRDLYRRKTEQAFARQLESRYGPFYLIPEGGTNSRAVRGARAFAIKLLAEIDFDTLVLPVGTGGTIAGMITGLPARKIVGVPVLKNGSFLINDINALVQYAAVRDFAEWKLLTEYHHGGYAKSSPELLRFIDRFIVDFKIPLEPVYSGKAMFALFREIETGKFTQGSKILFLHTGGVYLNSSNDDREA